VDSAYGQHQGYDNCSTGVAKQIK